VKEKLGLTLTSKKTRSGRIYRIVRAKTSAPFPSPSASGTRGTAMHETGRRRTLSPKASHTQRRGNRRSIGPAHREKPRSGGERG
jgi:hypothetical protein